MTLIRLDSIETISPKLASLSFYSRTSLPLLSLKNVYKGSMRETERDRETETETETDRWMDRQR